MVVSGSVFPVVSGATLVVSVVPVGCTAGGCTVGCTAGSTPGVTGWFGATVVVGDTESIGVVGVTGATGIGCTAVVPDPGATGGCTAVPPGATAGLSAESLGTTGDMAESRGESSVVEHAQRRALANKQERDRSISSECRYHSWAEPRSRAPPKSASIHFAVRFGTCGSRDLGQRYAPRCAVW